MIKLAHPIIDDEARAAVLAVLASGQLAQGPRVAAFEAAFAAYIGVKHAVALNSGTAALHVAFLAHGIGAGDEVIVPAMSFAATANAVLHASARPAFVDVREADFGMDPEQVEAAITPKTRAVVPVHLYGQICDIEAVRAICERRGLVLIEDAAQAVGATLDGRRAGSFGTGCFSFYATKNLHTVEGGMITTDDDGIAERARVFRSQGERTRYVTEEIGYNYRMTEIGAAIGLAQMAKIEERTEQRRANAARLTTLIGEAKGVVAPSERERRRHVFHQYVLRVTDGLAARDAMQAALRERGIEAAAFYPTPIHHQPLYRRLGYGEIDLPVAERLSDEVLAVPVHPSLTADELEAVAAAVRELAS